MLRDVTAMKTFFGLRAYGTAPQVWGDPGDCEHDWTDHAPIKTRGNVAVSDTAGFRNGKAYVDHALDGLYQGGAFCSRSGCWRGELGSEPTVALFVAHLCEVFDAVRRVLHPQATLLVELGDSYSGSGKGPSTSIQGPGGQVGPSAIKKRNPQQFAGGQAPTVWTPIEMPAKNLLMVPFRFAIAMQDRGWILRSVMPWVRRNAMPESATDRPSSAVSYVFLFAQQGRYFWDGEAVRQTGEGYGRTAGGDVFGRVREADARDGRTNRRGASVPTFAGGRNMRNSDLFFASWQGLLQDEDGDPLALIVNPQPLSDARISKGHVGGGTEHFASFPEKLVEPLIRAGSSEMGVCSACRAPLVRVVERSGGPPAGSHRLRADTTETAYSTGAHPDGVLTGGALSAVYAKYGYATSTTTGWRPSCSCVAPTVPALICDPFGGSGTTSLVAERLGRDSVYCELNPEYVGLAKRRLYGLLFADMEPVA